MQASLHSLHTAQSMFSYVCLLVHCLLQPPKVVLISRPKLKPAGHTKPCTRLTMFVWIVLHNPDTSLNPQSTARQNKSVQAQCTFARSSQMLHIPNSTIRQSRKSLKTEQKGKGEGHTRVHVGEHVAIASIGHDVLTEMIERLLWVGIISDVEGEQFCKGFALAFPSESCHAPCFMGWHA